MADAACEDTEMEYGMHVFRLVERIEHGTRDIEDALEHNPYKGIGRYGVEERFEGYQHAESHDTEAGRLDVGMVLEFDEANNGANDGTGPYKREEHPAPHAMISHRH